MCCVKPHAITDDGRGKAKCFHRFVGAVLCVINLLWALALPAHAAEVHYIYDANGRLVAVVDANGESAQYRYDSVGNTLGIDRLAANSVSLLEFSPTSGAAGTMVTVHGTAFDTVPGNNTVNFNGVAAVVSAATGTSLKVTVPPNASTGPITVANARGSATTSTPFIITSSRLPTISSFSPSLGTAGTAVTIVGTNFENSATANRVELSGRAVQVTYASATRRDTIVPSSAASGKITVATVNGLAVSADDFYAIPSGIDPASIEYMGRIAVDDMVKTVAINTAGKSALLLFDGIQRQYLSMFASRGTFANSIQMTVYAPDGTVLVSRSIGNNDMADFAPLPVKGTYTIFLQRSSTGVGKIGLQLKSPLAGTIAVNAALSPITLSAGQNGLFTFTGNGSRP